MAPPQVNLNEKPPAETSQGRDPRDTDKKEALLSALTNRYNDVAHDPLPEKQDERKAEPVIVTMDNRRMVLTAEQRRQRKRCRIACCASLSFLLVLLMALGTACLVYRMRHRKQHMRVTCGTKAGDMLPEHVKVDHDKQLIYVKPEHHSDQAMEILHEYNRRLIAFKNTTAKTCYLDRLDETFADGYARWQGYEETMYKQNNTLRVFRQKIDIEVVEHIADVYIYEHCGKEKFEYHWVRKVTEEEIRMRPDDTYITV